VRGVDFNIPKDVFERKVGSGSRDLEKPDAQREDGGVPRECSAGDIREVPILICDRDGERDEDDEKNAEHP